MEPSELAAIEAACRRALGHAVAPQSAVPAAGGCIHACYRVHAGAVGLFVKLNSTRYADAFAAEADGLAALREAGLGEGTDILAEAARFVAARRN